MTRMPIACFLRCAFLVAGIALAGPALAHPHVWVVSKAEIAYEAGKVAGVRHSWMFDAAYTAFVTQGLDTDKDGKLSSEELQGLAAENTANLAEFAYFTKLKVAGREQAFAEPREPRMVMEGDRLTLSFLLPLKTPAAQGRGVAALEVYDPTYFVSFGLAESADAVLLKGAPTGCAVTINRPKTTEPKTAEAGQPMTEAFFEALTAASTLGVQYANRALVACP
ncbi:hypothetical protein HPGCJGGD_4235 [Methylobacterium haplocladii]|nr:hypothetical protein HPGCJGGD_4235 [Methylobacterium haplocladii]